MDNRYIIGMYLRISSDDGFHGDSQSIAGQRDLINEFIRNHAELKGSRIIEFSDDGYSGTNFNRPGITQLLEKTRTGEINSIIVKDFSRFGRNYIDVGDYIEQIFPFLNVRFISINDCFDSSTQEQSAGDVGIAFKHLCNDYYCKDLSRKVKSGLRMAWESGKHLSSFVIYGYKKDPADKYCLIIDENSASVVRGIFDKAIAGVTPSQIALALNTDGVLTPLEYLVEKNHVRAWSKLKKIWTGTEITRIIRDLRYTGLLIQGMTARDSMGSIRSHRTPESEWVIHQGKLEPIVTNEEFEKAQQCIRKIKRSSARSNSRVPSPYSFPVKIRCGGCGHAMVKNNAKVMAYYCRYTNMSTDNTCFTGRIEVETLKSIILSSIQQLHNLVEPQKKAACESVPSSIDTLKEIHSLQRELSTASNSKLLLYNQYSDGEIGADEYTRKRKAIDEQSTDLVNRISILEKDLVTQENESIQIDPTIAVLQEIPYPTEYSSELVSALVEHVVVHDEKHVEVKWKFNDMFDNNSIAPK